MRVEKSKNSDSREVPLNKRLTKILKNMKKSRAIGNYVFCKEDGEKRKCVKEAFSNACERAGLEDFRFHDLRHTAASLLAGGGCDIITLQNVNH
jgi:integrase